MHRRQYHTRRQTHLLMNGIHVGVVTELRLPTPKNAERITEGVERLGATGPGRFISRFVEAGECTVRYRGGSPEALWHAYEAGLDAPLRINAPDGTSLFVRAYCAEIARHEAHLLFDGPPQVRHHRRLSRYR